MRNVFLVILNFLVVVVIFIIGLLFFVYFDPLGIDVEGKKPWCPVSWAE